MEKLKILTTENKKDLEKLKTKSKEIPLEKIKKNEFKKFIEKLKYTAKNQKLEEGWITAGLAAIQVGTPERIFIVLNTETNEYQTYINPEIKKVGNKCEKSLEGCLSLPKKQEEIERFKKIKIKYINEEGKRKKEIHSDYTAKVIQHEYDHLEGILFTQRKTEKWKN